MPSNRQEEVEGNPFQDVTGRWHNPDGGFMDDDDWEAAKKDGSILPPYGPPPSRHRATTPPPQAAASTTRRNSTPRKVTGAPVETDEEEATAEGSPLENAISRFYALHEQQVETHAQLGECLETIVAEMQRTLEPVMALANQFRNPIRAAAKVSAATVEEPRKKGTQGRVTNPNDKRLAHNRPAPPEEEPEEADEDDDEEEEGDEE